MRGLTPTAAVRRLACIVRRLILAIRIQLVGALYTAEVTEPHGRRGDWKSVVALSADELIAQLEGLGCHQTDIADAFYEADPEWLSRGPRFETVSEEMVLTSEKETELKALVVSRAPKELAAVDAAESEPDLFYALPRGAAAAFHLEKYEYASELAARALALAPSYKDDWNFGNAVHYAHTIFGLVALQNNNLAVAICELGKAGATPVSPQLDSFGPTMQLAKALLRCGESEAVLAYLSQCRNFWKTGAFWLDLWEQKIRAGAVPNFFMHSYV
jgi:tetratricopeptide (TPR) repeat protein